MTLTSKAELRILVRISIAARLVIQLHRPCTVMSCRYVEHADQCESQGPGGNGSTALRRARLIWFHRLSCRILARGRDRHPAWISAVPSCPMPSRRAYAVDAPTTWLHDVRTSSSPPAILCRMRPMRRNRPSGSGGQARTDHPYRTSEGNLELRSPCSLRALRMATAVVSKRDH